MTNPYFPSYTPFTRDTSARAEALNATFDSLVVAFNGIPDASALTQDRLTYCTDAGGANAYAIAPDNALASYIAGQRFSFIALNANTGASTINVSALGVKTIKRPDGNDLAASDITAGRLVWVQYDGMNFQMMTPSGSDVMATVASALAAAASASAASSSAGAASSSAGAAAASAATAVATLPTQGTWTPVLSFGGASVGITYGRANGLWERVGNLVTLRYEFILSSKGSSTGAALISGLPFTVANIAGFANVYGLGVNVGSGVPAGTSLQASVGTTTASVTVLGGSQLTNADFTNTSSLGGSLSFRV